MTAPPRTGAPTPSKDIALADFSTFELAAFFAGATSGAVAIVPLGSTEPHGPHLPLSTDILLSEVAARRAALVLNERGKPTLVAPSIPYGITRYATGFRGALGITETTFVALLVDVARALLDDGFSHVAFVNNHLEPEHVRAIENATSRLTKERGARAISFPNQLSRRWGRTLTDEFKRGNCHAGRYETSLVLAARPDLVRQDVAQTLAAVPISLSDAISTANGATVRFAAIGMDRAYTGAPAEASTDEGDTTYALLVDMIVTEVTEHIEAAADDDPAMAAAKKEEKHR